MVEDVSGDVSTGWRMSADDVSEGVVNDFSPHHFWGWVVLGWEGASIPGVQHVVECGRKNRRLIMR